MKLVLTIGPLLLLAGCLDAGRDAAVANAPASGTLPTGGLVEGDLFLPPSSGEERVESLVEIPANFSGLRVVAAVALGARYGPIDAPAQTADVLVELRGPEGDALVDAHLGATEPEARLEAETTRDGPHTLAILSFGGSDGEANGDYVRYRVEATPVS